MVRGFDIGRAIACGLAGALLLVAPARVAAQTEAELERARAAFGEGVQLLSEDRWDEAAARFREVLAVRATPQVRYNLGVALYHGGEIAEAADLLAMVVDSDELDRRTRRDARRILTEIQPRLAHLTVRILGDEGGASVLLDDRELGLERIGQPISVSPGSHRVVLSRDGAAVATREVTLAEGESADVSLTAAPGGVVDRELVDREVLVRDEEEPRAASGNVLEEWWLWTAIGGGVLVIAGVAIGVGVASSSGGEQPAVQGNLQPGVLDVMVP